MFHIATFVLNPSLPIADDRKYTLCCARCCRTLTRTLEAVSLSAPALFVQSSVLNPPHRQKHQVAPLVDPKLSLRS
jgi:hypothetical protein